MRVVDNETIREAGAFCAAQQLGLWAKRSEVPDVHSLQASAYSDWRKLLRRDESPAERHLFVEGWESCWDSDVDGYDIRRAKRRAA